MQVPKAEREAAVVFANRLLNGGGRCQLRTWTVKDPGGNIDNAVEVVCSVR
jgi:hypothetical protein